MTRTLLLGTALATLGMSAMPALGHHSVAAEFDTTLQGELAGEITQVWFTNPHIRYRLTIARPDGSTEDWELQAGNVTNLRRQGWVADSIKVGDQVTVSGDFGRDGATTIAGALRSTT